MTSKRPKLSLQTSDITPTYVGPTDSRNATISAIAPTPTGYNTFNNAFDLTYRPSPSSTVPSPGGASSRRNPLNQSSPYTLNLPYGVQPILKNSPLARDLRRSSLAPASPSPRATNRRIFFPAPKHVSFKSVLEEEIVTTDYVVRHADLSSSDAEESSSSDSEEPLRSTPETSDDEFDDRGIRVDEGSPRGRRKRNAEALSRELDSDAAGTENSTNTASKRTKRKKRRWEWTIPPAIKVVDQVVHETVEDGNKTSGQQSSTTNDNYEEAAAAKAEEAAEEVAEAAATAQDKGVTNEIEATKVANALDA